MSTTAIRKPSATWGGGISPFNVSWGKMFMWFFLVSDAFTFSSLLVAYGTLRHRFTEIWPAPGDVFTHFPFIHGHVPLAYVGFMTFDLIMSSVTMVLAVEAGHRRSNKGVIVWLALTIVGGFIFVGSQAWEWYHFIEGSGQGAYILEDGRFARTDALEPGMIFIWQDHHKTIYEGPEAAELVSKATKNIHGANLIENEYGNTPLFANFF
ncbi:MAG: cytochrome oxidase subunit III, partial [Bacteroidota bacterium]